MLGTRNIFLVGLMGAGKTTVGKALARRLGKQFFDSDLEIERRTGVKVQIIFEIEGEAGFREREAQMIEELAWREDIVLATGGGAVLRADNRRNLAARGFVIYLRANPRDLWARTRHDKSRPLLQTSNPLTRLEELYSVRDPLYQECADLIVDTGKQRIATLVAQTLLLIPDQCKLTA
jgi:shikimate kinase